MPDSSANQQLNKKDQEMSVAVWQKLIVGCRLLQQNILKFWKSL